MNRQKEDLAAVFLTLLAVTVIVAFVLARFP